MDNSKGVYAWVLLRISLGLIFLWAFLDKLFGLGFSTCRDAETGVITTMCPSAWLSGGSPTTGFLSFAAKGPFAGIFKAMAGSTLVDWLFMLGLLGIGIALIFGIFMKLGTYSGSLMLFLMWLAVLPKEHHPFLDEHIIYIFALLSLNYVKAGQYFGLGKKWINTNLVNKYQILE